VADRKRVQVSRAGRHRRVGRLRHDIGPDTRKVANPARTAARKTLAAAQDELATAERALAQLLNGQGTPKQKNAALPGVHRRIDTAIASADDAKTALRPIRAKILATDLDPRRATSPPPPARPRTANDATTARVQRRSMAGRTLHNAYLADPNEYRAIVRNLLHLGGHIDYTTKAIRITLDRPERPRIARALQLLTEDLNATQATMSGDHRPLTYQLAQT
jgi:hypothetical protein